MRILKKYASSRKVYEFKKVYECEKVYQSKIVYKSTLKLYKCFLIVQEWVLRACKGILGAY